MQSQTIRQNLESQMLMQVLDSRERWISLSFQNWASGCGFRGLENLNKVVGPFLQKRQKADRGYQSDSSGLVFSCSFHKGGGPNIEPRIIQSSLTYGDFGNPKPSPPPL